MKRMTETNQFKAPNKTISPKQMNPTLNDETNSTVTLFFLNTPSKNRTKQREVNDIYQIIQLKIIKHIPT